MRLKTLKRRAEFDRVRAGRKWVAKSFVLQGLPRRTDELDEKPRFGFVLSGKVLAEKAPGRQAGRAGAVERNRAKRRLREAIRMLAPAHASPGYDYVVIGRREALHQRFADLLEDLRLAFEKVHRPARAEGGAAQPVRRRKTPAGEI